MTHRAKVVATALVLAWFAALTAPAVSAVAQERASARLSLASQTPWVDSDDPFVIRLDVGAVRRPQQLALGITIHRAITSRSQFARTLDGDLLGSSVHRERRPFQDLLFDAGGAVPLTVELPQLGVGVYPVSIEVLDTRTDDERASLVTHVVRVPDRPAEIPLNVAWVQPYGASPALAPDGTVELSEDDLDDLRTIAAHLDTDVPMTVIPTPETIAALATLDGGRTVRALAELLANHQVVSAPFVDVDVSALVAAGRTEDLSTQRVAGDAVLTDVLGISGDIRTWTLDRAVTEPALRAIGGFGVRRVVLDEDAMEPLPPAATGRITLSWPFRIEGTASRELDAVAVDPGLVAHLDDRDPVLAAHHLLADLAWLYFDRPGTERGVVIRPPATWRPSNVFLGTVLGNLGTSPVLRPVTVDTLFDTVDALLADDEPLVRELRDVDPRSLGFDPSDMVRARSAIGALESLLVDRTMVDIDRFERLLLVAESTDLGSQERAAYIAAVHDFVRTTTSNVKVLGDRTYRLTAREGTIPVTLVNDNDFPVRVDIALTSDKLEFVGSRTVGELVIRELDLAPNRSTTAAVPVKARTSGQFNLRVVVHTPAGGLELGATRYTITSTVASGVGLFLSFGAAAFLLLWWGRHWRTVTRARRLVAAE